MISARRKAELADELQRELDTVDRLEVQAKDDARERREEIVLHRQKVRSLRDLLAGREVAQSSLPGTETGTVKPRPAAPKKSEAKAMRDAADEFVAQLRKGELTRWIADARAKRVPTFVIEQTGIRTKAGIIAKWGENAVFEKGKPCPRDRDGLHAWESKRTKGKPAPAARPQPKRATRRGAPMTAKPQWEKLNGEYIDQHPDTGLVLVPGSAGAWELRGRRGGERVATLIGPIRDLTRALVCTYGELWAMAEKLSAAEPPRATAEEIEKELCLDCGVPAGKPSPGCEGCDHPDEPKGKKGRPKGAPQDDCAKCGAPSYALVDGQPTCHPCYEKVAKGSAA